MSLVEQWNAILADLPGDWQAARLRLRTRERVQAGRAAALLGPANPGRYESFVTFQIARRGGGTSPDLAQRLLARLDAEQVVGALKLVGLDESAGVETQRAQPSLAAQWALLVTELPEDWSDAYVELTLGSSDYLERAALLFAPANPSRVPGEIAFRFRAARRFGYGASGEMMRRCCERLDEEQIRGTIRILWALSDTRPVYTQGPVWYAGGRAV
jgi:hypothetical protein